jgi:hypothetical protein
MTEQTTRGRVQNRAQLAGDQKPDEAARVDAAWFRFRDELDARILARFGLAFEGQDGDQADPDILADLALQRALMP